MHYSASIKYSKAWWYWYVLHWHFFYNYLWTTKLCTSLYCSNILLMYLNELPNSAPVCVTLCSFFYEMWKCVIIHVAFICTLSSVWEVSNHILAYCQNDCLKQIKLDLPEIALWSEQQTKVGQDNNTICCSPQHHTVSYYRQLFRSNLICKEGNSGTFKVDNTFTIRSWLWNHLLRMLTWCRLGDHSTNEPDHTSIHHITRKLYEITTWRTNHITL